MKQKIVALCLLAALLEGFAGLGIEIYAIRISATYIGASIAITGVILAAVLIAIAFGYWAGGLLSRFAKTAEDSLALAGSMLATSAVLQSIACVSQIFILQGLVSLGVNPLLSASVVGALFGLGLACASASIPLITQFLTVRYNTEGTEEAGKNAGMMVAITTVGSVLGSTITPILLLPYVGLVESLALFIASLAISSVICSVLAHKLAPSSKSEGANGIVTVASYAACAVAVLLTAFFIVSHDKSATGHQTAAGSWFTQDFIHEGVTKVIISESPNQSTTSSCWIPSERKNCFWYGDRIAENVYNKNPESVLFVGGAGMAIPSEVAYARPDIDITVVDIDKALPEIVEKHFLKEPIAKSIEFVGDDARAYLNKPSYTPHKMTVLDAFQGSYLASNLYTLEALQLVKDKSDYVLANVIGKTMEDHGYTQLVLNNWVKVFGKDDSYVIATDEYSNYTQNLILCSYECKGSEKLVDTHYFVESDVYHTDNNPRLERYHYKQI